MHLQRHHIGPLNSIRPGGHRTSSSDLLSDHDPMAVNSAEAKLAQAPGFVAERLDEFRPFSDDGRVVGVK
jgi:hypothetical protein